MPRHLVVQRQRARPEPFRLRVIGAGDQPHALAHHVAVEPGRAERVLRDHPAGREDHEIDVRGAGDVAGRGQHGEDRRIGVIEADRADRVEARQVVFPRHVIAVPRDDIERRAAERRGPQAAQEFLDECEVALDILEPRRRRLEIARIGEAVRADRARDRAGGTGRRDSPRHSRARCRRAASRGTERRAGSARSRRASRRSGRVRSAASGHRVRAGSAIRRRRRRTRGRSCPCRHCRGASRPRSGSRGRRRRRPSW